MSQSRTERLAASPPLFDNRVLNFFSRVHPAVPALIYVPVVIEALWLGADRGYAAAELALLTLAGVGVWTLTEYWLHRVVFHWQPRFRGGDRLHFIIHGVHHDHPNDAMRLVMPPAASIPMAAIFAGAYLLIFGEPLAYPLFAGLIVGYLGYDYTHYHLHHRTPRTRFGRRLRQQHMRHHFQDHTAGFGVTSPAWDAVFNTMPRTRTIERRPAGTALEGRAGETSSSPSPEFVS